MKAKTLLLLLLILIGNFVVAKAQHLEVSGLQSGLWDADTVLVTGDVEVVNQLSLRPGTVVLFDGFYHISVGEGASFSAKGKENDSIVFTVVDTTGFCLPDEPQGGWNGFQVNRGTVELEYCVLEYGKAAIAEDKEGGALRIDKGQVRIGHSSLRHNYSCDRGGAIHAQDADVHIYDSHINENQVFTNTGTYAMYGGGASFIRSNVYLRDMEFKGNYAPSCIGGALSLDSCQVDMYGGVLADNIGINGGGMYMMRNNFTNSTISNLAVYHNYSRHFAGGLAFADASPKVYNVLVADNSSEGVSCNGVFFYQESRPQFTNCIVWGNYPPEADLHEDSTQMWLWTFEGFAPEFRNCLIEGGTKRIRGAEYIQVFEEILVADPRFVDELHHDYHLTEASPCRDAGNKYVPFELFEGGDLDGLPRVAHQRIDIGPYEFSQLAVDEHSGETLCLYGNPLGSESRVCFYLDSPETLKVSLFSVDGRMVAEKPAQSFAPGRVELPIGDMVDDLVPGLYLIEIKGGKRHLWIKAVK